MTSEGIISSPKKFPELLRHIGEDLIVTDGHTLLGADDKAGIAEIIQAMCWLRDHPEVKHGKIRIAFNPDEEIGMGAHHFDVEKFGCDWAYTMDGGDLGELEFENFNAASAKIFIKGVSVHPGYAKDKMVNANVLATEFAQLLPADERPETTEGSLPSCCLPTSVRRRQKAIRDSTICWVSRVTLNRPNCTISSATMTVSALKTANVSSRDVQNR